jgi:hypothetical protein
VGGVVEDFLFKLMMRIAKVKQRLASFCGGKFNPEAVVPES